jgi:RNA recognition motif-containing protein
MPVRLFVGNLPYDASEAELREHFAVVGPLSHVFVPVDRETGRPRGFAFVEFADPAMASAAIARLHNQPFKGRPLSVSEARARDSRPAGGPPPSGGAPRFDRGPRPPSAAGPSTLGPPAPPVEGRQRNFGPDAPRRGKGRPQRPRREEAPRGPIPVKSGGRIYDVDDLDDETDEIPFDDFARSLSDDDENDSER